jgi:superfamily I DNA/RNA helicase
VIELPLSICYRCPQKVVNFAATICPGIEAAPDAPAGRIERIENDQVVQLAQPGDLILCRLNAPLVATCLALLRMGKRATVRGMDIGQRFEGLIERIVKAYQKKAPTFSPALFYQHLIVYAQEYEREELVLLSENEEDNEERIVQLEDNIATLIALYEGHCRETIFPGLERPFPLTFDGFMAFIKHFFKEDKDAQIILSTGHKAKGLEFRVVFVLGWNKLPHARATTPDALKQEHNLMYVMVTRCLFDKDYPRSGTLYLCYDELPEEEDEQRPDIVPTSSTERMLPIEAPAVVAEAETIAAAHEEKRSGGGRPRKHKERLQIKVSSEVAAYLRSLKGGDDGYSGYLETLIQSDPRFHAFLAERDEPSPLSCV